MAAWRPHAKIMAGELDNTKPGRVTGWMTFVGLEEPVTFDLAGDFHRDIRGATLSFTNPKPAELTEEAREYVRSFATRQTGTVGDITAGLPPQDYVDYPYVEWYSDENGRVVLELVQEQVRIIGTPLPWEKEESVSREAQERNVQTFLSGVAASFSPGPRASEPGEEKSVALAGLSRYEFAASGQTIVVGWDNPLQTFFAQVWQEWPESATKDPIQSAYAELGPVPVFWLGTRQKEVPTLEDLTAHLKPHAPIPKETAEALLADFERQTTPTAYQQWAAGLAGADESKERVSAATGAKADDPKKPYLFQVEELVRFSQTVEVSARSPEEAEELAVEAFTNEWSNANRVSIAAVPLLGREEAEGKQPAGFSVQNHGTVSVFRPLSAQVEELVCREFDLEPWQGLGDGAFAVDQRTARALQARLQSEGWHLTGLGREEGQKQLEEACVQQSPQEHYETCVKRAEQALVAYGDEALDANLSDCLADLMHWAKERDVDFARCLRNATRHHETERAELNEERQEQGRTR